MYLKQSTAAVISFGPFVSPSDGVTLQTGLVSALDHASTGIFLSKAGGAFAIRHATVTATTYDAYGNYLVTLDTTDTNTVGRLRVQFAAAASCLPVWVDIEIVPANIYDSVIGGTDVLDVSVIQLLGTAWLTPGTAGTPDVNAKLIGGTAQTGRDLGTSVLLAADQAVNATKWAGGTIPAPAVTGVPKVDLTYILGTILTETAGLLAGGFKKFFNVASPTGTLNSIPDAVPDASGGLPVTGNRLTAIPTVAAVTTVTNLTNAPTSGDLTATMKTSVTTAATAATPTAAAVTGAVGSVTGNVGGNVVGSVASVTARVTANVDQLGGVAQSLTDLKDFADDGYDPSTNKVQGVVLTDTTTTVTNPVTAGTVSDKTGYALTSAYDPAKTAAQAGDAMALTSGERTTLAAAIWNALTSGLTTVGSIGKLLVDNVNATISSRLASASYTTPPTVGAIADQVWEETLADHSGTAGSTAAALNAAGSAGDPWNTALPGAYGAGTAGKIIGDNINATVGSRATQASVDTIDAFLDTEIAAIKAKTDNLPASPAAAGDAMTLTSGERTTLAASIWNALTSGFVAVGSAGKLIVDNLNATVSSRSSHSAADVWTAVTRTLTAGTNIVLAKGVGVTGFTDISAAQVNDEMVDVLSVDTYPEPTGVPAATASLATKISWGYMALRNKLTLTGSAKSFYDDSGNVEWSKALSDDGTTYTESEAS